MLAWKLNFLVAEANMLNKKIYVLDLYVSSNSAKFSINNRINNLVGVGVLAKQNEMLDARRQIKTLTNEFRSKLNVHFDECIQHLDNSALFTHWNWTPLQILRMYPWKKTSIN